MKPYVAPQILGTCDEHRGAGRSTFFPCHTHFGIVEKAVEQLTVVQPKAMACLVDVDGLPRLRHPSPFVVSPGFSCRQPIEIRTMGQAGFTLISTRGCDTGLLISHVASYKNG